MQVQCLAGPGPHAVLEVEAGFLQPLAREVVEIDAAGASRTVEGLEVEGRRYAQWEEATERRVAVPPVAVSDLLKAPVDHGFAFEATVLRESLRDRTGAARGAMVRTQAEVMGTVRLSAETLERGIVRITVVIENVTPLTAPTAAQAAARLFASTHAVLSIADGSFVSSIDPPSELAAAVRDCRNVGCYPVLVGPPGMRNLVLAAPIVLYDHPQIAPESPGDFFDGTEMDEMLALRILTLTDSEKRAMSALDEHAATLLARVEAMEPAALEKLHGAWRTLRPERA